MNESAPDSRLDPILADYLRRIDEGETITPELVRSEQPELADQLLEVIDTAQLIRQLTSEALDGEQDEKLADDSSDSSESNPDESIPESLSPDESTINAPPESLAEEDGAADKPFDGFAETRVENRTTGADQPGLDDTQIGLPKHVDDADQLIGDTIDDYQILSVLGKGGMGVVYKARQISVDRIVAVKMILGGRYATEEDVQRFYIEAQAAARAKHPNIVNVYGVGKCEGRMYFAMEFIDGLNLAELAEQQGPLPGKQAATYLKKIALAMHDAHEAGVLHRDLKPANVLIDAKDQPRVTDFGLAKHLDEDSGLTASGAAVGTPSYMAPEQASGRHDLSSPQTDIYALGAVLYVMLTGQPPFRAATALQTIMEVINVEPPPPDQLNPNVDSDLQTICLKCLEKDPEDRFASAEELAEELDRYLTGRPILSKPRGRLEHLRLWMLNVPLVAAACGRPIVHPTSAHHRFQAAMILSLIVAPLIAYQMLTVWRQTLPRKVVVAAGPEDGAYHRLASLLQPAVRESTNRLVEVRESHGSAENLDLLMNGESHLAFLQAADLADLDSNRVVIVAPVHYEAIHVIVRVDAGIESFKQLAGRRVSLGSANGSSMQASAQMLLDHYDVDPNSLQSREVTYKSLLSEDPQVQLDAAIVTIGLGSPGVRRILADPSYKLLELSDAADFYHPTLRAFRIPAHTYGEGIPPEAVQTVATPAFLAARRRAPDALVRAALEALYQQSIPGGVSRRDATDWPGLALHPEAQLFFAGTESTSP